MISLKSETSTFSKYMFLGILVCLFVYQETLLDVSFCSTKFDFIFNGSDFEAEGNHYILGNGLQIHYLYWSSFV